MVGSVAGAYGASVIVPDPNNPGEMIDLMLPNAFGFSSGNPQDTLNALLQFTGEEVSSQGRQATESAERNFGSIGRRLSAIRQGLRTASSGMAFNMNGMDIVQQTRAGAEQLGGTPLIGGTAGSAGGGETGWGWFASADYGFGDRDESVREDEFEYDSFGFTIGVDYAFDNSWVLGATVTWDDTEIDFESGSLAISQNSGGGLDSDGYSLSGFVMYNADVYFTGILSWGQTDYDLDRVARFTPMAGAPIDLAFEGSTDADQISGEVTVGKVFGEGEVTFDLYVSADFQNLEIDGFTERDLTPGAGLALQYDDQDIDSFQSVIGGVLRRTINTDSGVITPYIGLEWHHEFDNDSRVVDSRYALALPNTPTTGFTTPTEDPDEDYGEITLGISAQLQNSLLLFLQWDTVVGLEDASSNLITLGIRGVF